MTKYQLIINTVQNVSGIEDITSLNRMRFVADCRHVCYGLAKKYYRKRYNGYVMSKIMKRTHAAGINSINSFENNINKSWFEANEVYNKCVIILDDVLGIENEEIKREIERLDDKRKFLIGKIKVKHEVIN